MAKKKPTAKDMADMLSNKPLPGQAIAVGPDVDPRAGQFQQAMGSMMATPDDYYRWERDQAIEEQNKKAFKNAFESMIADEDDPEAKWEEYLDGIAQDKVILDDVDDKGLRAVHEQMLSELSKAASMRALKQKMQMEMDAHAANRFRALQNKAMRGFDAGNLTPEERAEWQRLAKAGYY